MQCAWAHQSSTPSPHPNPVFAGSSDTLLMTWVSDSSLTPASGSTGACKGCVGRLVVGMPVGAWGGRPR